MSVKKKKLRDDIEEVGDKVKASANVIKNRVEEAAEDINKEYEIEKTKEDLKDVKKELRK